MSNLTKKSARKKDVFIALWHYDKQVLQRLEVDETSVPASVPVKDAEEAGIISSNSGEIIHKSRHLS